MAGGKFARLKKDGAAIHRPRPVPRASAAPAAAAVSTDSALEGGAGASVSAAVGENIGMHV